MIIRMQPIPSIFIAVNSKKQSPMLNEMRLHQKPFKYWWISLLAGILSIVGGILCFSTPIDSLAVLTLFFVAILIVGGIFNIASAFTNRKWNDYWGWDLARGIIELLLGVWLYMLPLVLVTTTIVYVFGFWMLFHSIIGICESCELARLPIKGWGWLLACNILSLICSFLFLTTPIFGGLFILVYIGVSFILYGIFRIVLAFKMHSFNRALQEE